MSHAGSNKKVSNTLLALSSAAIFAVYTAGYSRTQSAANRFAAVDGRRPAIPAPPSAAPHADAVNTSPAAPPPNLRREAPARREATARPENPPVKVEPTIPAAASTPIETPAPTPPPAAEPAPIIAEQKVEPKVEAVAPPPPPAAPAALAAPPHPVWKDGTYTGWGYSRHGDIQASVVIEGGRIASASIAQCLTRYSCSVIDELIPQPAKRQSPEVDNISGATQSADSFYFAVVEALAKAK